MEVTNTENTVQYRCRKCRQPCDINSAVLVQAEDCDRRIPCESNLVYLDTEQCPEWIISEVQKLNWTKGKLNCVKCGGRLGSFDFLKAQFCYCSQHQLPPVHLLKDRLDIITLASASVHLPTPVLGRETRSASSTVRSNPINSKPCHAGSLSHTSECEGGVAECEGEDHRENCGPSGSYDNNNIDVALGHNGIVHHSRFCDKDKVSDGHMPETELSGSKETLKKGLQTVRKRERRRQRQNARLVDGDEEMSLEIYNRYHILKDEDVVRDIVGSEDTASATVLVDDCDRANSPHGRTVPVDDCDKEDVPYDWTCCVCMELYHQPHSCRPCGHMYCDPCLRLLSKTKANRIVLCPLCRKVIMECTPNDELRQQIKATYPHLVKERARRVRELGRLQSIPLPQCTAAVPRAQTQESWLAFGRLFQRAGAFLRRFVLLFLLLVFQQWSSFRGLSAILSPEISNDDDTKILTSLTSGFEKYKSCLRCVKKASKSAPATDKLTEQEEKEKQTFKSWMVLGANSVLKGLERDTLSLVLMCRKTQPAVLKSAILSLVVSRQCPAACVSDLLSAIQQSWPGLTSLTVMGMKKTQDANDFTELVQYVKTVPQPNVPEIPQLVPAGGMASEEHTPGSPEEGENIQSQKNGTKNDRKSVEDCGVVDPTKYYVYKSNLPSAKTFSGQDFLEFEKETSSDVIYVNVTNGKVDIHRDLGRSEIYGIAPPLCGLVKDETRSEEFKQERKRPADSSGYKGIKIKRAVRDMSTAKQKRKQEKREAKKQNKKKVKKIANQ